MNNKKIQKRKLIIFIILIIILLIISFLIFLNRYGTQRKIDKGFFIDAMKDNDISHCFNISKSAEISGKEINSLITENNYDNRTNFLSYGEKYLMRDSCETLISLSREAQAQFPKKD